MPLCFRDFPFFIFVRIRISRPAQERPRPVCISSPARNAQGGRGLRSAKLSFPHALSFLQNRRTTTSDVVVFGVFVGILNWYILNEKRGTWAPYYIGWGRAGRACPVGSFAQQISLVSRPSLCAGLRVGQAGQPGTQFSSSFVFRPPAPVLPYLTHPLNLTLV